MPPVTVISDAAANLTPFAWTITGAGSANAAVRTQGDSQFIEKNAETAGESNELTTFDFSSIPPGSVIVDVVINWYSGRSAAGAGNIRWRCKLGANTTDGAYQGPGASWTNFSQSIARPGGGTWTRADLVTTGIRIVWGHDGTGSVGVLARVDQMQIEVTYLPPSGGYAFLIV